MRAAAQRLTRDSVSNQRRPPATILRQVVGLQAQVLSAAALGMRVRSTGLHASDVSKALNDDRSIVRSWLMRGTLHVVASDDIRWLVQLLGPVFVRAFATRHAQLELNEDLRTRGVAAIRRILSESGPLTRYELVDRLRARNIGLNPKTQAPIHLIGLAALQSVLCVGPDRGDGESRYVLLDDWIPRAAAMPSRELALAELARRYFTAYGPATIEDFKAWSGIPMAEARSAVARAKASLTEVTIQRQPGFVLKDRLKRVTTSPTAQVRLLPTFDTYLLGYRRRDLAVPPALQRRLQRGGGWLHPAVVVNGHAVAAWSLRKSGSRGAVNVEPCASITRPVRAGIEAEVADIGRFLDLPLRLEIAR
jgi:hypothetical protein